MNVVTLAGKWLEKRNIAKYFSGRSCPRPASLDRILTQPQVKPPEGRRPIKSTTSARCTNVHRGLFNYNSRCLKTVDLEMIASDQNSKIPRPQPSSDRVGLKNWHDVGFWVRYRYSFCRVRVGFGFAQQRWESSPFSGLRAVWRAKVFKFKAHAYSLNLHFCNNFMYLSVTFLLHKIWCM